MTDANKFKILLFGATTVTALALSYSLAREYVIPNLENYVQRRLHYSQVIEKKGLSLHKAVHWKQK